MAFLRQKKKDSYARIVIGSGPSVGKSTLAMLASHSDKLGPVAYLDVEGSARFYKKNIAEGSEYIDIQDVIECKDIVNQLSKLGNSGSENFPFKTIIIDTWYSLFKRFTNIYDDINEKSIEFEYQVYDGNKKSVKKWGEIKSPFTKIILDILYLPANIIWLTWERGVLDGRGAPIKNKFEPRYDGLLYHMSDVIVRMDQSRKLEVFRDKSGILKNGTPANVEFIEKIVDFVNSDKKEKIMNESKIKKDKSEDIACSKCGKKINPIIAKATAAQNDGKPICPACLKK